MRTYLAALALAVGGCSVDVGAGQIDPVAVNAPVDVTEVSPPLSLDVELIFFDASQSAAIADQYGNKLGAVDHIDVDVKELALAVNGTPLAGSTLILGFEGVTVERAGDRVRLPDATKQKVLAAITQRTDLSLPMHVTVAWPMPPAAPSLMAHALFQPVIVVNALDAL